MWAVSRTNATTDCNYSASKNRALPGNSPSRELLARPAIFGNVSGLPQEMSVSAPKETDNAEAAEPGIEDIRNAVIRFAGNSQDGIQTVLGLV